MTSCWACEAELDPQWKYCIRCGVAAEKDPALASALQPKSRRSQTLSPIAVFGWIVAGIAAALIITAVVLIVVLHR